MEVMTTLPAPADVLLADGHIASIRPLRESDRDALVALHDAASDEAIRLRFFTVNRAAGRAYADHLVTVSGEKAITLVALGHDRLLGEATAERLSPDTAEVAFLVADDVTGLGIGSLLLEHLAAACRELGIRRFVAEVLADNSAMLRVFRDAGFSLTRRSADGVTSLEIEIELSATAARSADLREFRAEATSLHPLLYPSSVAVLGARRDGGGIGHAVLTAIRGGGFAGDLYVVHPQADEIDGLPCFPALTQVPGHVDLAVLAVPARHVGDAMLDAVAAEVSSVVVISSGFSELGPEGAALQAELVALAREHSIRLVGPNCLGVLANDPGIRLNATFNRVLPPAGGLAIASQSGGVGIALLDVAREIGLGVHSFISLGNKADVSGNDLLSAWYDDDNVTAAALYLESFGNALKFARIARRFAERKPLLAVVGGRSAGGRRAGSSHTAAAATPAVGVETLFAQAGVIACHSAEEMARAALVLAEQPLPRGPRLGIISNAGGIGVLTADAAVDQQLTVPALSATVEAAVRAAVTGTVGTSNPVDLGAGADAAHLAAAMDALLGSGEIDALVVAIVATNLTVPAPLTAALAESRARYPDLPVVLAYLGDQTGSSLRPPGVTVLRTPDEAVEALGLIWRYAAWLATPRDEPMLPDPARVRASRAVASAALGPTRATTWLDVERIAALLEPYGVAPVGRCVTGPVEAGEAATDLGFPVVVKVADPEVVHKTDRGLVKVGLLTAAEVAQAVHGFEAELGRSAVPVLVQAQGQGVEVAVGIVRDPGLGPLVMVGAGGVATGVWDDQVFLMPPLTRRDGLQALRSLRIHPLLEGYRGSERADLDALADLVVSVGALAVEVPEVVELDLNPVLASASGVQLVDVKIRVATAQPVNDGVPRQLRSTR